MITELLKALLHEVAPDTGVHVHIFTLNIKEMLTNTIVFKAALKFKAQVKINHETSLALQLFINIKIINLSREATFFFLSSFFNGRAFKGRG